MLYEQEISLVRLSDGDSGRSSFVHIKYSNDGKTFTTNNGEDIGSWLGIYTDDKEEESTVFSDYKWSKILGATGAVGTGIDSVTKEFYLSDSKTTQSGSSWQTKMPEWSYGKYLWTREKIIYKNPTSTVYTTPSCDSSWEAANVVDKKVTTLQTDFKVEQGKIESLVKETSTIKETYTTKDEFNSINQASKLNNLIINGYGELGNNTNFKDWTFLGNSGQFDDICTFSRESAAYGEAWLGDDLIPINILNEYTFSLNLRPNKDQTNYYVGFAEYDVDKNRISYCYQTVINNTCTELAKDLKDGDTVIYLKDISAFGVDKNTPSHQRGLIFWNYKDSQGHLYEPGVYSRNMWEDLYDYTGVDKATNTIKLKSAWNHGTIVSGTKVSQSNGGGYKYFVSTSTKLNADKWTNIEWKIKGKAKPFALYPSDKFNPATKYIKFVLLPNYGNSELRITYINSICLRDTTLNSVVKDSENKLNTKIDGIQVGGRNLLYKSQIITCYSNNNDLYPISKEVVEENGIKFERIKRVQHDLRPNEISLYNVILKSDFRYDDCVDKQTTLSFKYRFSHKTSVEIIGQLSDGKNPSANFYREIFKTKANQWQTFSYTFTNFPTLYENGLIRFVPWYVQIPNGTIQDFYIDVREFKLELGNKPTDWTPAPEDLEQKVTTLTDKYNQIVQTVEGNKTTIANVKTSVDDVTGKVTKMESSITEIKQTADGVKTTVTANKDKWDKASSDASNAVSTANKANGNASTALNKATTLETKANNGEFNGRGVKSTTVEYQASTSGTTAPSGTWSPTVPTVANGSYLWTRTTITYTSGDPSVGYSVARMGVNGAKGDKGETGQTGANGTSVTVKSTAVSYGVSSSASTKPSSFSPTMPTVAQGQYLWTKTVVTYSDGNSTETFTYALQGVNGAKGDKGLDGKNGVTYYTWIKYADSPTSGMSDSPTNKKYMGIATNKTSSAESTNYSDYTWSLIKGDKGDTGDKGNTGATGNGIVSITYTYARTTTQTTPSASSVTSTTMPTLDSTNKYLWQKEIITYTNGQTQTNVALIAVYGDKGQTGAKGADGKSPTVSVSKSGSTTTITVVNADGSKTTQTVNDGTNGTPGKDGATGKTSYFHVKYSNDGGKTFTANNGETVGDYLGTYTDFVEADSNSVAVYTWVKIKGNTGATGAKGETGSDGKGISSIVHHYLVTNVTTGVTSSTSGWKDTPQSVTATNKYLWYYQTINYTAGTPTNTTPAIVGVYGDTGNKGATGKGISSVTPQYYLSTSSTTQTGGSWKTTQDAWSSGKYYWTRDSIAWSDGTTTTTTPTLATGLNNANSTALSAQTIANQTASKFQWIVKSGNSATDFTLTDRTAQLVADSINLKGLVTFKGLDSSTQNKITDANNKIDNLQIGGRNLIKGTTNIWIETNTGQWNTTIIGPNKSIEAYGLKVGDTVTFSVDIDGGEHGAISRFTFYSDAKGTDKISFIGNPISKGAIGKSFLTHTITSKNLFVELAMQNGDTTFTSNKIKYKCPKLELGNKATAWTPAPEDKANQSVIDNWAKDSIVGGETTINGGYIKTNTIKTDQLAVHDIFATGSAAMNIINAQEINANRITSGLLSAERINAYGLSILNKTTNQQTFNISNNGEVTIRGSVSSGNYVEGKTGWAINNDGTAEFNDIIARGSVITNDGGIVSSGGTGKNLLLNSNFSKSYTGNSFTVNNITYNTYAKGYGGYNGGINNPKTNYHAYLDTKTNHIVFDETNGSRNWKGIVPDGDTFPALVGKNITSLTLSMQTKASDSGTYVFGGFYYIKKGGTIRDFHAGQFEKFPPKGETRISTAIELGSDVDWSKGVDLYIYGYNFSTNSKLEIWDLKLEEGTVATPWSPAPEDKLKQVRFWAGGSYDERESAPWIVYSDGSMKATQGEFSGVFSGTVDIGNIKIADPSSTAGNDALLTIQNGSNGIKRVQLTDNASSSFAQDIIVTNNTYSTVISLKQDGSAYFSRGINIADKTTLNSSSLIINNNTLTTTPNGSGFLFSNNLDIGTANKSASLNIHGDISTDNITIDNTLYFGNVLKFTKNANGINIDFI